MDSVVKDEKKHDQRLKETMKIFEDEGDQCLQKRSRSRSGHHDAMMMTMMMMMRGIKKRPPRCHDDDDDDDDDEEGCARLPCNAKAPYHPQESDQGFGEKEAELGRKWKKCADMEVILRKWNMKKAFGNSTSMYVLVTNWKSVMEMNSVKEDETVQLWSFQIKSKLGFALAKRRLQDDPRNCSLRVILDS
ncbi:hypothetical protein AAG906_027992 [Vitis piasezkii]